MERVHFCLEDTPEISYLTDITVRCEDIVKAISKLKNNEAPGPDGIPAVFYKQCAEELSHKLQRYGTSPLIKKWILLL